MVFTNAAPSCCGLELAADSLSSSCGSCSLDLLVPHDTRCKLGLGLGQAGSSAAVQLVDLQN